MNHMKNGDTIMNKKYLINKLCNILKNKSRDSPISTLKENKYHTTNEEYKLGLIKHSSHIRYEYK